MIQGTTHTTTRKPRFGWRKPRYNTTGFRYFTFDQDYGGDDVYSYYFLAKSSEDVARATGVEEEYIFPCTMADIQTAIQHRKHIDLVVNGQLIDMEEDA